MGEQQVPFSRLRTSFLGACAGPQGCSPVNHKTVVTQALGE